MSQTKAQLVSGTTAQDLTVDNINTTSINSGQTSGSKNLVINGAFQVAQRGTSSTTHGYQTVDRFTTSVSGADEAPTQAQVDVASGTTPYTLGFRKAFKMTNGNQTGGAGAADRVEIICKLEAQDIANSGWNYLSSSSYITLSYWVKSSVAQNFNLFLKTSDGTAKQYPMETGSLSADTWTKITKTIPGDSGLQIDNDNAEGLRIDFPIFYGTDLTNNSASLNAWANYNGAARTPDQTSTWYTTNDATFEITGVQLEVGSTATDFEHRTLGQELALCQRYFFNLTGDNNFRSGVLGYANSTSEFRGVVHFPVPMRANATFTGSATAMVVDSADDSASFNVNAISLSNTPTKLQAVVEVSTSSMTAGQCGQLEFRAANGFMNFDAEL